jgi:ribose 5-phosphate isomerase RpiB
LRRKFGLTPGALVAAAKRGDHDSNMRTVIGSDHAGFELKTLLVKFLRDLGASIAASKTPVFGRCCETYSAHQGVETDDMNFRVRTRVIEPAVAHELVAAYAKTRFTNEEQHARRLNKVKAIEARSSG